MGFGSYDESEHEHREEKKDVNTQTETSRATHNGEVKYAEDSNVDDLLDIYTEDVKQADNWATHHYFIWIRTEWS